jgi:type I restriction enzyme R subunit
MKKATVQPTNQMHSRSANMERGRVLRIYGYPPDKQEEATLTVLEQAELICADWAA